jgi:hypothetical protein
MHSILDYRRFTSKHSTAKDEVISKMALAHNALIIATCQSIFLGLAWIFVLIRLYIRKCMIHSVALDDYFLILTVVSFASPTQP